MIRTTSLAALAAVMLAASALAQGTATTPAPATPAAPGAASTAKIPTGVFFTRQTGEQFLGRDRLIGASVRNKDGQIIGDIEDLIINRTTNTIEGVVMGVGGFLGVGEKKVGVRFGALQLANNAEGKLTVTLPAATKDVVAALPAYQRLEARKGIIERTTDKAKELGERAAGSDAAAKARELGAKAVEQGKQAIDAAKGAAGMGGTTPAPTAPKQ